jgi:hypothetical protein
MMKILEVISLANIFSFYIVYPLLMVAAWASIHVRKIRISALMVMTIIPVALGFNTYIKMHNIDKLGSNMISSCASEDGKGQIFKTLYNIQGVSIEVNRYRKPNDPYTIAENYLNPGEWAALFLGGLDGYSYVKESSDKGSESYTIVNHQIKRDSHESKRGAISVKWDLVDGKSKVKQFNLVIINNSTGEEIGRKPVLLAEIEPVFLPMTPIQISMGEVLSCPRQSSLVHFIKQVATPIKKEGGLKL